MDNEKLPRINDIIIDEFKFVKNNKFVEITSNRDFIKKDSKILYNMEHMRNHEFEEDLKKWANNQGVLDMYFKMKKWILENHPEEII